MRARDGSILGTRTFLPALAVLLFFCAAFPALLAADTLTHTTVSDFSPGTYAGWGATVTANGGGAVELGPSASDLTVNFSTVALSDLPAARSSHTMAAWNGRLYVVGGDNAGAQSTVYRANINGDGSIGSWTTDGESLSQARRGHAMVVWDGWLYVAGGDNSGAQSTVYKSSVNADGSLAGWTATTALPAARTGHAMVAWDGRIYVLGGADAGGAASATVYVAPVLGDGAVGSWTELSATPLPAARHGAAAAVYNGRIFVAGGSGAQTVYTAAINADGTLSAWSTTSPLLQGRQFHAMASVQQRIFLTGGGEAGGISTMTAMVGVLNETAISTWTSVHALFDHRQSHAMALWNGWLYVSGGGDAAGNATKTVWKAPVDREGAPESWASTVNLSSATNQAAAVAFNGRLYNVGGEIDDASLYQDKVVVSDISEDGTIGSWSVAGTLVEGRRFASADIWNGRLYVFTGRTPSNNQEPRVEFAPINADGTLGEFKATGALPTGNSRGDGVIWNGRIYVVGGILTGGSITGNVYRGDINPDTGEVTWVTESNSLITPRRAHSLTVWNNILYAVAGCSTASGCTRLSSIEYAVINKDGTVGAWATTTAFPEAINSHASVALNGRLYVMGGETDSNTNLRTVRSIPIKADGALGSSWTTETDLPEPGRVAHAATVWKGRILVSGGATVTASTRISSVTVSSPFYFTSSGTYYGPVVEFSNLSVINAINVDWTLGGADLEVQIATAAAGTDPLSPFMTISTGSQTGLQALYLGYKFKFDNGDAQTPPRVNSIQFDFTADQDPPAAVTNLSGLLSELGAAVDLTWTAPGDDGTTGTLAAGSEYRIQYTSVTADAESATFWSTASAQVSISTSGVNPGDDQAAPVTALSMGTTYYFRIWTKDPANNYSALSNGATQWAAIDNVAPSRTPDLSAATGGVKEIDLTWTSPGDDGDSGTLQRFSEYRIQHTTVASDAQSGTFWSTASAQVVLSTEGVVPGALQGYKLQNLLEGVTYYLRLWTKDETHVNFSPLSNGATAQAGFSAPNAITNLSTLTGTLPGEIDLSWTAPGKDGTSGDNTAEAFYTLKYATYSADSAGDADTWWSGAFTYSQSWTVSPQGTTESQTLVGLSPGTTYYLAIKTTDDAGIVSAIDDRAVVGGQAQANTWAQVPVGRKRWYLLDTNASSPHPPTSVVLSSSPPGGAGTFNSYLDISAGTGLFQIELNRTSSGNDTEPGAAVNTDSGAITTTDWFNSRSISSGTWVFKGQTDDAGAAKTYDLDLRVRVTRVTVAGGKATNQEVFIDWTTIHSSATLSTHNFNGSVTTGTALTFGSAHTLMVEYFANVTNWAAGGNGALKDVRMRLGNNDDFVETPPEFRDVTPPAAITNLSAITGADSGEIDLTWTAPGDDGTSGDNAAGAFYTVKHATFHVDSAGWTSDTWWSAGATEFPQSLSVGSRGATEALTVDGLTPGELYYFAVRTTDEGGNQSSIDDNAASGVTQASATAKSAAANQPPLQPSTATLYVNDTAAAAQAGNRFGGNVTVEEPWFSAFYDDPDDDSSSEFQLQISSQTAFNAEDIVWDSCSPGPCTKTVPDGTRMGSEQVPAGKLQKNRCYWWRIRFKDAVDWGPYASPGVRFGFGPSPSRRLRHGRWFCDGDGLMPMTDKGAP